MTLSLNLDSLQGGLPENIGDVAAALTAIQDYVNSLSGDAWAPGDVVGQAHATVPSGWLLCDGALVSRSTYAALFGVIDEAYGAGDGSTTFKLPDWRDRVPVGASGTIPLGSTGGEKTHVLTVAELAGHHHGPHDGNSFMVNTGSLSGHNTAAGGATLTQDVANISLSALTTDTGSGTAHNNMQPYQALHWRIKT